MDDRQSGHIPTRCKAACLAAFGWRPDRKPAVRHFCAPSLGSGPLPHEKDTAPVDSGWSIRKRVTRALLRRTTHWGRFLNGLFDIGVILEIA
jgi:hypothetical protein